MWKTGKRFGKEELDNLKEIIISGNLTSWNFRLKLEKAFSQKFKIKYAISMNSAASTLAAAVKAAGIGPGDEVIVDPFLMFGASATIINNGIPVFADLDPETFLMSHRSIQERITRFTKAIIVQHTFGLMCEMDPIMAVAKKHNLIVIEDGALAAYAQYKGRPVGTIGDIGIISGGVGKPFQCGEGGIGFTNNKNFRNEMMRYRAHGFDYFIGDTEAVATGGIKTRMTEFQAAIALSQLKKWNWIKSQYLQTGNTISKIIKRYGWLSPQNNSSYCEHSYGQFAFVYNGDRYGMSFSGFRKLLQKNNLNSLVGFDITGSEGRPIYLLPLIQEGRWPERKCPFECKFYRGKIRYYKGLCPQAEMIIPKLCVIHVGGPFKSKKDLNTYIEMLNLFDHVLYELDKEIKKNKR